MKTLPLQIKFYSPADLAGSSTGSARVGKTIDPNSQTHTTQNELPGVVVTENPDGSTRIEHTVVSSSRGLYV